MPDGDPAALEAAALGMRRGAGQLRDTVAELARCADRVAADWSGPASELAGGKLRRAATHAAVAPRVADAVAEVVAEYAARLRSAEQAPAEPSAAPTPAGAAPAESALEVAAAARIRQLTAELTGMRPDPYGPVVGRRGEPGPVDRPQAAAPSSSRAEPEFSWDPGWVAKASWAFSLLAAPAAYAERLSAEAAKLGADARSIRPPAGPGQQERRAYKQARAAARQGERLAGRAAGFADRVPGTSLAHSLNAVTHGVPVLRFVPGASIAFTGLGVGVDVAGGTSAPRAVATNVAGTGAGLVASTWTAGYLVGGAVAAPAAAVVAVPLAVGAFTGYVVYKGSILYGDDVARGVGRAAAGTGRAAAGAGRAAAGAGRAVAGAGRAAASDAEHAATGAARDARRTWHRVFG